MPVAAALGEDSSSLSISRSTVRRERKNARTEFVDEVAKNFTPKYPTIIHWDSKILPDIVGKEVVDRLTIIASGDGEEKLLGGPQIAVYDQKKCSRSNLQNAGALESCKPGYRYVF